MKVNAKHIGSTFDSFLQDDGIAANVEVAAAKRITTWRVERLMEKSGVTKTELARRMRASCAIARSRHAFGQSGNTVQGCGCARENSPIVSRRLCSIVGQTTTAIPAHRKKTRRPAPKSCRVTERRILKWWRRASFMQ